MKYLKRLLNYIFTRFSKIQLGIIAIIFAFAFVIGDSNLYTRLGYDEQIRGLNSQIEFYHQQTESNRIKLNELQSNRDNFEKYARENYLMKKQNEDVFVLENENQ